MKQVQKSVLNRHIETSNIRKNIPHILNIVDKTPDHNITGILLEWNGKQENIQPLKADMQNPQFACYIKNLVLYTLKIQSI